MRISLMSVSKKRFKTAFPKDPVPPVINNVLSLKILIFPSPPTHFLPLSIFNDYYDTTEAHIQENQSHSASN